MKICRVKRCLKKHCLAVARTTYYVYINLGPLKRQLAKSNLLEGKTSPDLDTDRYAFFSD